MAPPHGTIHHQHPALDVGGAVAQRILGFYDGFEVAHGQELEDEVDVLVPGGEDAEEVDYVWVRVEFGEVLAFSEGGGGDAVFELGDDFYLFDGDEGFCVGAEVAFVDIGVGAFAYGFLCAYVSVPE